MNRLVSLLVAAAILAAPLAATAAPAPPVFSFTAKATKVADGSTFQSNGGRQVAVAGNTVYVAYHGPAGEPTIARSTDGGATWGVPAILWSDPAGNPTGNVRVAVAKDLAAAGKHVVAAAWETAGGEILYAYFVDRPTGAGWSAPAAISAPVAPAYAASLSAAPNGSIFLFFTSSDGVNYLATAPRADAPFSTPQPLPWGNGTHNLAVAFDASSNVYVAETHVDDAWVDHLWFHRKLAAGTDWSTVDVAADSATMTIGDNVSIAVYDSNSIYIAYKQYPFTVPDAANHVWTAVTTNGGATWTKRIVTPNATVYGTHPSIAVDSKKIVTLAAHYVNYGPDGRVTVNRSNDNCATWSPNVNVAGTQQVSLALDANGKALVSAVLNDTPPADQAFVTGAMEPGWNARPIYFTRER